MIEKRLARRRPTPPHIKAKTPFCVGLCAEPEEAGGGRNVCRSWNTNHCKILPSWGKISKNSQEHIILFTFFSSVLVEQLFCYCVKLRENASETNNKQLECSRFFALKIKRKTHMGKTNQKRVCNGWIQQKREAKPESLAKVVGLGGYSSGKIWKGRKQLAIFTWPEIFLWRIVH